MALKKGDILDERKRHPDSCGLVVKFAGGGEGFQKIRCCGHELTEEDRVPDIIPVERSQKRSVAPWSDAGGEAAICGFLRFACHGA